MIDAATFSEFGSTSTRVSAPPVAVWKTMVDEFGTVFFGAHVETTWELHSPIVFTGDWEGSPYHDHGEIVEFQAGHSLRFTQHSSMSGKPDAPESYDLVSLTLTGAGDGTVVTMSLAKPPRVELPPAAEREQLVGNLDTFLARLADLCAAGS